MSNTLLNTAPYLQGGRGGGLLLRKIEKYAQMYTSYLVPIGLWMLSAPAGLNLAQQKSSSSLSKKVDSIDKPQPKPKPSQAKPSPAKAWAEVVYIITSRAGPHPRLRPHARPVP